jgi:RNA polymerase sigma-70 factor (ECF subfamily)
MSARTLESSTFGAAGLDTQPAEGSELDRIYAEHFRYVWRCLRALGVPDSALDDAVHDVFVVVQQKLAGFDGQAQVTTWLYAIALRIARRARATARKEAWRFAPVDGTDETGGEHSALRSAAGDEPEQALERGERLSLARRALARLDDDKREAFVLSQVEQRSAPEIADITGLPLNTVYSRVRAAKTAFRAELGRLELILRGKSR